MSQMVQQPQASPLPVVKPVMPVSRQPVGQASAVNQTVSAQNPLESLLDKFLDALSNWALKALVLHRRDLDGAALRIAEYFKNASLQHPLEKLLDKLGGELSDWAWKLHFERN